MHFRIKKSIGLLVLCNLLLYITGCNPPSSNNSPNNEQEQEVQQPLPSPEDIPQTGSSNPLDDTSAISSTEAAQREAVQRQLDSIELEKKKLELMALRENQRTQKSKTRQTLATSNSDRVVEKVNVVEEPKAPVVEVSYSKAIDLKLLDQKIIWRAVGPGSYDISVTRAADNALVFNSSVEDTVLSYSALELDESVRYAVKVQYGAKKLGEKKSFSLIAGGKLLNPTCK